MNLLKIIAMLFVFVAVVSAAGCAEKAQITENETQNISENVTNVESPTTHITLAKNVSVSKPSVTSASKNRTDSTSSTVVDVVCKMKIDKKTAEFTSEYKGTTYYFCALSCKEKFDENPEKYISSEISENNSETTENGTQETSEKLTDATSNNTDSTSSTVVDVVCKMEIDKKTAEFTNEYKGTTYYFCSDSCKEKFDENPEKYISSEISENNSETTENETKEAASEQVTSAAANDTNSTSSTVVDVVCKMQIDKRTAEFTSVYKGTTYYFCSASCKKKFDENPEKYINSETTENETQKDCKTTENKTQEASGQVTSAATNDTDSTSSTVVDAVCKMKIDKRTAEFKSKYKGTTYYFCSASCKEKFDDNPRKYINSETTENNSTATENNSKTAENNSETKENKTQEASEQITSVATNSVNSTSSTVVDVVCKMKIDKKTVEFKSNYKGKMYYFCSASCKEKFDENPGKYT